MHRLVPFLKTLAFIMLCLWPLGCAISPPTKFYLLSPLPVPNLDAGNTQDRKPTTISENEIHLADLNQWGEPLRDNLTNILALNLSRLLPAKGFAFFPFKCPSPVDYQVSVEIVRMDGRLNGDVHLTAQWSILQSKEGNIMVTRKSRFKASKAPTGYDELVAAQSRLVQALSREIAKSIQENL